MKIAISIFIIIVVFALLYIWSPINITINRVSKGAELALIEHIVQCNKEREQFAKDWLDNYLQHVGTCNKNTDINKKNNEVFWKWFKRVELYWNLMEPDIAATIDEKIDFVKLKEIN